jgi:hypothetical protein
VVGNSGTLCNLSYSGSRNRGMAVQEQSVTVSVRFYMNNKLKKAKGLGAWFKW